MEKPSSASSDPLEEEDTGNGTMVLSMSAVSEGA
ncbi:hypothetical protein Tco_0723128, partial [Tanacetum coccineum]